jgi:glutamate transport system permease protein
MKSSSTTVLFDELGPKGKARLKVATIVAVVVVLAALGGIFAQLEHVGQLSARLWSPLWEWPNIRYLLDGLGMTLRIGLSCAAMSLVFGTVFGLGRLSPRRWLSVPAAAAIELFRAIPLILLVYFFLIGLPTFG